MSISLDLHTATKSYLENKRVLVAVSGGSDSLGLLHLLRRQVNADLVAVSVDHGLREGSGLEAEAVARICADWGVEHVILRADVERDGNLQANARAARYDLFYEEARRQEAKVIAIGHTLDDLAETYMLNSFRGSGVDGLAAMREIKKGRISLVRPMLHLRRAALREELERIGVAWVDDPSNEDMRFNRVKMRAWLGEAEALGFSFENLGRTVENMQRVQDFLRFSLAEAAHECIEFAPLYLEAKISLAGFVELHEEVQMRLLAMLCQFYGGSVYKPRLNGLENLRMSLSADADAMTLDKTMFEWSGGVLRVYAEFEHLPEESAGAVWSRFRYLGDMGDGEVIGALGGFYRAFDDWREWGVSVRAAKTAPAVFRRGVPIYSSAEQFEARSFWEIL